MQRLRRIGLIGVILVALITGCGQDTSAPIEKSPDAPTPDQIKGHGKECDADHEGWSTG